MSSPPPGRTILEDGKLKPGSYKIQNIVSKTYLDIHEHSMELCCRPASALGKDDGIWEVLPFGAGYTIRMEHPEYMEKPDCFCTVKVGLTSGSPICVSPFPVAWSIKVTEDEIYEGFEYVRIFWGQNNASWDLESDGSKNNGARVQLMDDERILPCRAWKLTPVKCVEEGETCCSCTHHDMGTEHGVDDYGTTVIEVTTVSKTTRKKYRVTEE
ncbi:hypothetical protein BDM02DRAFT_3265312 [Thelephora ganbajun]|uniref:Uncharacterized protein n=1 Tax=Thelephora ganbajun TaxID=370292 RepID=A0ACB6ZVY6_THEGA|nr:hypothetical protein BDM02DRAFT_3265312 [Thelephora ganbajun]